MKKIKLIEVRSEIGAGTRGAGLGVDAIKIAALDFGSSFFKRHESVEVPNENKLLLEPVENEHAKRIKGVYSFSEKLAKQVSEFCKEEGTFPIVLAGDHASAIGVATGIKMAFPHKRLGIVWIDAHADMHSPYTTPSGNMHGMPIAALLGEDNKDMQVNKPDDETIQYWEKIKNLGDIYPKVRYEDIVMVSVRDYERQEEFLLKKHNVKNISVTEIRNRGAERIAALILTSLESCDVIYISFDVDSMDPELSRGTGTPVPGGLTEKEAGSLIYYLLRSKKVCCLEVVEVNPTLDKENQMAENAFEVLLKATNQLINDF
ncbi:MAG TPA: arginase [Bacteroidia bacterium]|nr:arginase [Bacteroidia bacterium]